MAVSEATLRENYRRFSNEKLLRLASEDAAKLRPEALVLLREELATRGLAAVAEKAIAAQLRVVSEAEIAAYGALLQAQPCPGCQSAAHALNATVTSTVRSFLVLTPWNRQLVIACPPCLDKLSRAASLTWALLGWWGLWGVLRTVQALIANGQLAKANHAPYPNDTLKAFVVASVGQIEAASAWPLGLQRLLDTVYLH